MGGGEASFERLGARAAATRAAGGERFGVAPLAGLIRPCSTSRAPPTGGALAHSVVHPAIQNTRSRAIRREPFAARARHESRVGYLSAKPPWLSRAVHGMEQPRGRDAPPRHRLSLSRLRPRAISDEHSWRGSGTRRGAARTHARGDARRRPRHGGESPQ